MRALVLIIILLWPGLALAQNLGPGLGTDAKGAAVICNSTVTGKVTVDAVALTVPLTPNIAEGQDCAQAIATIIHNGYEELYSNLAVGTNRVEFSFSNFISTRSPAAENAVIAVLICNSATTGRITVDGFAASDTRLVAIVNEGEECAKAIVDIEAFGLGNRFASVLAAPERSMSAYTDLYAVHQPARVAILTCNANTTGTYVVDGVSISFGGVAIAEQDSCANDTAILANLGLRIIFIEHAISLHRMIYALTDHP